MERSQTHETSHTRTDETARTQTDETGRRLDRARKTADLFAALPGMRAAVLVGSTARGQCDRYSDIDMTALYDTMPARADVDRLLDEAGATERRILAGTDAECVETFRLDGIEIQVGHTTLAQTEEMLDDVLLRFDTDHDKHTVAGGLREAVALRGPEHLAGWQARLEHYPDGLALAMVKAHLTFAPPWFFSERVAGRDTLFVFSKYMIDAGRNLMGVLLGLNRLYPEHDFKRLGRLIDRMSIKPRDLHARVSRLLQSDYAASVETYGPLVEELLELVAKEMPEVDQAAARARFFRPDPGRANVGQTTA